MTDFIINLIVAGVIGTFFTCFAWLLIVYKIRKNIVKIKKLEEILERLNKLEFSIYRKK